MLEATTALATSIQHRLADLYSAWRREHTGDHLVECGLVDEASYAAAPLRIVWVLKEAVDEDQTTGWILPGYFLDVARGRFRPSRTARPLGALTYGLLFGADSYEAARHMMPQGLRALGVTNLKKSGGGVSSKWAVIDQEAERTKHLWREQPRVMRPQVILCGATLWNVAPRLRLSPLRSVPGGARYSIWSEPDQRAVVVEARHPASWTVSREQELTRLRATLHHARGAGNLRG
jgi:hypothetical protein